MLMQRICIAPLVALLLTSCAAPAGNFDGEWADRKSCGRPADSVKSNAQQEIAPALAVATEAAAISPTYPKEILGAWVPDHGAVREYK